MATSIKAFKIELYQEHLEEASFLYEQRLGLLHDPEIAWWDVGNFEDRLEAHIDALVVGDQLALDVCKDQAKGGDFGELFGAVCVFCRQKKGALLAEVLQTLDYDDPQKLQAVVDALKYEFPPEWQDALSQALARRNEKLLPLLAKLCGYKRIPLGDLLLQVLPVDINNIPPACVWALGRLKAENAIEGLWNCLRHPDDAVCLESLLALLRLGEQRALQQCHLVAHNKSWPYLGFGLGGNRTSGNVLCEVIRIGKGNKDCLLALGLLGDLTYAKTLHECLSNPDLSAAAAQALNLITGADLYEEVFIPEPIDEDELFEKELKVFREEGKVPTRLDGKPFGTTSTRLSQNPDVWKQWFSQHASKFDRNYRYRNGKLFSPACLLDSLVSEKSHYRLRQFACEELAIRYGVDFHFEADMPVFRQLSVIQTISEWVKSNNARFQAGYWYFASRLMQ